MKSEGLEAGSIWVYGQIIAQPLHRSNQRKRGDEDTSQERYMEIVIVEREVWDENLNPTEEWLVHSQMMLRAH